MALLTFTPPIPPAPGTTDKPKFKVLAAEFGDGYTGTTRDGLNHIKRVLSLTWEALTPTQAEAITSFIYGRGGDRPFYYTPSDELTALKWKCTEISDKRGKAGFRTVTLTLEQTFTLET